MKKSTKVAASILLATFMVSGAFASGKSDEAKSEKRDAVGALSFLNLSEENFSTMRDGIHEVNLVLQEEGYFKTKSFRPNKITVRYYDTLDAMLMALKSGEITAITGLSQTTGKYLCAKDPSLAMPYEYDLKKSREQFANSAYERLCDGFSFMLLEKNAALRDQINGIIDEMKKDGSLQKLIDAQIFDATSGKELEPIVPEQKAGRETIKVAVTGALPPMDYVAANGTFAGFNTALLAEVGKRLDKNISMVQVSSVGRATALASGTVDVVFWTRSASEGSKFVSMDSQAFKDQVASQKKTLSEKEKKAMEALTTGIAGSANSDPRKVTYGKDMPEGVILTEPYFTDVPVTIILKK